MYKYEKSVYTLKSYDTNIFNPLKRTSIKNFNVVLYPGTLLLHFIYLLVHTYLLKHCIGTLFISFDSVVFGFLSLTLHFGNPISSRDDTSKYGTVIQENLYFVT